MTERLLNAPIAPLFLIIGTGYLLGKQKIHNFEPGVSIRCAARRSGDRSLWLRAFTGRTVALFLFFIFSVGFPG